MFVVGIDPLLRELDARLRGVRVGPVAVKAFGYMDDIQILSSNAMDTMLVDRLLSRYEQAAGLILNRKKCKILGLGAWAERERWPVPWLQPVDQMKTLGIYLSRTIGLTCKITWEKVQKSFSSSLCKPLSIVFYPPLNKEQS